LFFFTSLKRTSEALKLENLEIVAIVYYIYASAL